jgi:uncharacterized zinc-type alcohol dehydrogenase-like protein
MRSLKNSPRAASQCLGTAFQISRRQPNKICEAIMTAQFSPELRGQYKAKGYAAANAKSPPVSLTTPRRNPGEHDVQIEILYCGICHSDLHQGQNEWSTGPTVYPSVPGHEIVGRVTKVGSGVTRFKPGDQAAVGCLVDSDGNCTECRTVLPTNDSHLQLSRRPPWRRYLWWLFRQYCGQR